MIHPKLSSVAKRQGNVPWRRQPRIQAKSRGHEQRNCSDLRKEKVSVKTNGITLIHGWKSMTILLYLLNCLDYMLVRLQCFLRDTIYSRFPIPFINYSIVSVNFFWGITFFLGYTLKRVNKY